MSSHSDVWAVYEHIFSLINVAAVTNIITGGIYRGTPLPTAEVPYITIRAVPGMDLQIVNGIRIWSEVLCDVVAVGKDLQWEALDRAAAAFDALLQATDGTTTSGRVFSCVRVQPISFDELDEGIQYVYVGGSYRVTARAT